MGNGVQNERYGMEFPLEELMGNPARDCNIVIVPPHLLRSDFQTLLTENRHESGRKVELRQNRKRDGGPGDRGGVGRAGSQGGAEDHQVELRSTRVEQAKLKSTRAELKTTRVELKSTRTKQSGPKTPTAEQTRQETTTEDQT